jgi:hypothetical protein
MDGASLLERLISTVKRLTSQTIHRHDGYCSIAISSTGSPRNIYFWLRR